METVKILNPGPFTTVQDIGRFGYQRYGMAPAGAMDEVSFQLGNHLLGNEPDEAALEFTLQGPRLEILNDTVIAVTGGWCELSVNGEKYPIYAPVKVSAGDQIDISRIYKGLRGYVCFRGGLDVPVIMNSRSTYLRGQIGGFSGRILKSYDKLYTNPKGEKSKAPLPTNMWPEFYSQQSLDVIMGPQKDYFTEEGIKTFLSEEYTISEAADRMGYRLSGPEIEHQNEADIISDGIPLGAIQVPGHRQPIIMMKDRQTTGGYPKIATVASYEIYKLAQTKPGDKLSFNKVSLQESQQNRKLMTNWFESLVKKINRSVFSHKNLRIRFNTDKEKQIKIWELE